MAEYEPDRDHELRLLKLVLDDEQCVDEAREAFEGMLEWLKDAPRGHLSAKQRAWLEGIANKLEVDQAPVDNSRVPRGKEVAPAWSTNLPKKPPRRT